VRSKRLIALLVAGLVLGSFAAGNYATGQTKSKIEKWEYTTLRHSPILKEKGSDMRKIQGMGTEGWELASSYRVKGELIVSIFKRRK
jgi:hypothetical protein